MGGTKFEYFPFAPFRSEIIFISLSLCSEQLRSAPLLRIRAYKLMRTIEVSYYILKISREVKKCQSIHKLIIRDSEPSLCVSILFFRSTLGLGRVITRFTGIF